jgi:hypothetical protein
MQRAQSPQGLTTVIATYEDRTQPGGGGADYQHLRLVVADTATGKVSRVHELVAGSFYFSFSTNDGNRVPSLRFLDESHVLFSGGSGSLSSYGIDLRDGAIAEFAPTLEPLGTRLGRIGDSLVDLTTNQRYSLTPEAGAFQKARLHVGCHDAALLP